MRTSTLKRCLLLAAPVMFSMVFLFQNCGPAQVTGSASSMDMASTPTVGLRVDLNALLKSPQEPASNVLYPLGTGTPQYDYSVAAPIIETVVLKKNNFDRIDWVHGPSATVVANGDTFSHEKFSPEMLGPYYIFGYRGETAYLIKQFEIVEKSNATVGADSANAVSVAQSQAEMDATTETVLITADAPDVDLNKVTFLLKNNNTTISDKRAILVSKKLVESFDVVITFTDMSGNSATRTVNLSAKACDFNGNLLLNGANVTAFQATSVAYGQTCTSQTRTCSNGSLSGSYTNSACTVRPPASCSLNGATVAHGASVNAYQTANVPYGQTCAMEARTCNNGVLSGSYANSACTVLPPGACTLDGRTVAHAASITAFQTATVPYGQTCVSQSRTCTNGVLSGTYPKATCSPLPPASCTFNGSTVPHAGTVTAYLNATVPFGTTCSSQVRTCNNGTLSGTNPYGACTVLPGTNIMNKMAPTTLTVLRGAKFSFSLLVTRLKATPTALLGFAHLVPDGSTVSSLSIDWEPGTPTNLWSTNSSLSAPLSMTVPATLAPGTYTIRAGFYQRTSPYTRYKLDADTGVTNDGLDRYIVGTVIVK